MITINPQAADVITIQISDADQITLNTTAILLEDRDADTLQGEDGTFYLSRANHTGTQAANTITGLATVATSGSYNDLSDKPTISTDAATLNGQDGVFYLSRANHTGTQAISTVTGLQDALNAKLESVAWGGITGTLSDQTDLQGALNLKLDAADYNDRFLGLFSSVFDLEAAHPTANAGDYAQVDWGIGVDVIIYAWDVSDAYWAAIGVSTISTTDDVPEGSGNLYFTSQRVRDTSLTGLSTATATAITAADTVLAAAGKLQGQASANATAIADKLNTADAPATVRDTALTGLSTATATPVTAADTVLVAAGKLQAQATDNAANSRLRFILTSTWALLPAANSVPTNTRYFVSDIGINGSDWYTDGVRWRLVNGRITLFADNAARTGTGATGGDFLTFNIPAGVMGATGAVEITTLFSANNNANTKTVRVVYAGVNYMAAGLTNAASCQMMTIIRNRTANSQVGANGATGVVYGPTAASNVFTSADSAITQPVTLRWILANAADTVTLESVRIDLIA